MSGSVILEKIDKLTGEAINYEKNALWYLVDLSNYQSTTEQNALQLSLINM
jgi:hypothetical protein